MAKYTGEQKAQALKSMEDIGVTKTKDALGVSVQTLYKWKSENVSEKGKSITAKKTTNPTIASDIEIEKISDMKVEPIGKVAVDPDVSNMAHSIIPFFSMMDDKITAARELLKDDNGLLERVAQLEAENAKLWALNLKLRKALASLVE